jgi:hypothetical protein
MNSPDRKSLSGTAPHHTLPSNTDDCHSSSHLSLLRSLSDRKREAERMDVIATDSGWDLEGGRAQKRRKKMEKFGHKKVE